MLKHIKTIGNFDIVKSITTSPNILGCFECTNYIVRNKGMDCDSFTSLEKAEQFITEILQKYNGE